MRQIQHKLVLDPNLSVQNWYGSARTLADDDSQKLILDHNQILKKTMEFQMKQSLNKDSRDGIHINGPES